MKRNTPFGEILKAKNIANNTKAKQDIGALTYYADPTQGYDWTITNCGDGKVRMSWTGNGQEMYIGELKAKLRHLIESVDKAAESWGVPNNLDGRGRELAK